MFTSRIAEIIEFRYLTETANSSARSLSMFPSRQMHGPRLAIKQTIHPVQERQVLLGPFALRHRHIKCYLALMRFRGESTSSAWTERCLARSAGQENS